jgi:hypothetical protein
MVLITMLIITMCRLAQEASVDQLKQILGSILSESALETKIKANRQWRHS